MRNDPPVRGARWQPEREAFLSWTTKVFHPPAHFSRQGLSLFAAKKFADGREGFHMIADDLDGHE